MRGRQIARSRESVKPFRRYKDKRGNSGSRSLLNSGDYRRSDTAGREAIKQDVRKTMRGKEDSEILRGVESDLQKKAKSRRARKIYDAWKKGKVRLG